MSKTWNDQPDEVEGLKVVATFHANVKLSEVRQATRDVWYVTLGNLLSSNTVKCYSPAVAFEVVSAISKSVSVPVVLPLGAELVDA